MKSSHLVFGIIALALPSLLANGAHAASISDIEVARAVARELTADFQLARHAIKIVADDGIASLNGSVANLYAKQRAGRLAETVRGVRAVVNLIEVVPTRRLDAEIREDVVFALAEDNGVQRCKIDVTVDDGAVRLSGRVDSWTERDLAETIATAVDGVYVVKNNIDVVSAKRTDREIHGEIRSTLRWDALVDADRIGIKVRSGEVILDGVVRSAAEKRRVLSDARVAGVTAIDADRLRIVHDAVADDAPKARPDDNAIADAIRAALKRDPRVRGSAIDVEVVRGRAILRGQAANLRARRAAAQDARNTVGVRDVETAIVVRAAPDNAAIAHDLNKRLLLSALVEAAEVKPKVAAGVVHLYGSVDSYAEKRAAEDIAATVPGVREIRNLLEVEERTGVPIGSVYVDDFDAARFQARNDTAGENRVKTDEQIAEDVRAQLYWSPFVDASRIYVGVSEGVAILSGSVDSLSEVAAAVENAFEGGAVSVSNNLKIR